MEAREAQRLILAPTVPLFDHLVLAPWSFYSTVQSAVASDGRVLFNEKIAKMGISKGMPMWHGNVFFETAEELLGNQIPRYHFEGPCSVEPKGMLIPSSRKGVLCFKNYVCSPTGSNPIIELEISGITSARKGLAQFFRSIPATEQRVLYEIERHPFPFPIYSLKLKSPSEINYSRLAWKLENRWFSSGIHGAVTGGVCGLLLALTREDNWRESFVSTLSSAVSGALSSALMSFATDALLFRNLPSAIVEFEASGAVMTKLLFLAGSMVISYAADVGVQAINKAIG